MTKIATDLPAAIFGTVAEEAITAASGRKVTLPERFASNQRGDVSFTARFARLPAGGELRSVHIHGARIEIINLFHFPSPERAIPVYAMEFVIFGRRPVVGVIDAKPLAPHPASEALWRDALEKAHSLFPGLTRADDPPPWYEECRSGLDFFTRPEHFNGLGDLLACHAHVWARLSAGESASSRLSPCETESHARAISEYKNHHRENSPGLPFLNRTFGAEWTDDFLRNALFA